MKVPCLIYESALMTKKKKKNFMVQTLNVQIKM